MLWHVLCRKVKRLLWWQMVTGQRMEHRVQWLRRPLCDGCVWAKTRGGHGGPKCLMSLRSRGWHLRAHCKQTAALKSLFTLRLIIHGDIFWSFSIFVFVLVKHQESCSPGLFLILLIINPCGLVAKVRHPCGRYHVVFYSFFLLIDSAWFPVLLNFLLILLAFFASSLEGPPFGSLKSLSPWHEKHFSELNA